MLRHLSYIGLSRKNLEHNIKIFRGLIPKKTKLAAVIKANAYGHGQNEIAKMTERFIDYFQVDDIDELRLLRKVTRKPALVLGYIAKDELLESVKLGCIIAIYDIERLKILNNIGKKQRQKPKIHLKIDAYFGRQGILLGELDKFLSEAKKLKNIRIEGIYSHYSHLKDSKDLSHTEKQIKAFSEAISIAESHGYKNLCRHISASSGALLNKISPSHASMVRIGIGTYGLWPSLQIKRKFQKKFNLRPVMRWVSHVAQVKTVPKNYSVGYGLSFITKKPTKIAVIPQGYGDGYGRKLSNKGEVLIRGKRCRVLGIITMNMFVVDVSHVPNVRPEDEVVLIGEQKRERITPGDIGSKIDTVNYEIVTRISPLLPRIEC